MTRIIITRHGQSEANLQKIFAGQLDFDLTELGKDQARLAAEYICANEKIDAIYSSDLSRAYNTALPTSCLTGIKIIPTASLREMNCGAWEGHRRDEIERKYPEQFKTWQENFASVSIPDAETPAALYKRAVKAVIELAEQNDGRCILLSTHAGFLRTVMAYSQGMAFDQLSLVDFPKNASIHIFTYTDGVLTPERLNITEHLEVAGASTKNFF